MELLVLLSEMQSNLLQILELDVDWSNILMVPT